MVELKLGEVLAITLSSEITIIKPGSLIDARVYIDQQRFDISIPPSSRHRKARLALVLLGTEDEKQGG